MILKPNTRYLVQFTIRTGDFEIGEGDVGDLGNAKLEMVDSQPYREDGAQ